MMRYLTLLFCILFSGQSFATTITTQLDRSTIGINESFSLVFEATGSVDDDPDFTPLEKDFDILNRSQSSNISFINGNYKKSQTWTLNLMAKQEGVLTIPSISFGADKSPQARLTVKAAAQADPATQDVFVEAEVSANDAYVQQQIIFTMRLLTSVNLSSVNFSDLKTENVDTRIEALSDGKQYRSQRGNRTYLVVEKKYALFPQQQGTLHIPALLAEAAIGSRSQSLFDPFNRSAQVQRFRSKAFDINIRNIPASFKGNTWLPSSELQLDEQWPANNEFKAGEPITRTISILANGLTAEQLPDLNYTDVQNIKQYPDQATLNNSKQDDGIIGIRQQKIALIPVRGGNYKLPAIEIPWWNIKTNKMETARIAERTFKVSKSANDVRTLTPVEPDTNVISDQLMNEATPPTATNTQTAPTSSLPWWISLFFAVGWLFTAIAWWMSARKHKVIPANKPGNPTVHIKAALKNLHSACNNNDPQACRTHLLAWGKAQFGDRIVTLDDLARIASNSDLQSAIIQLNACLYSTKPLSWNGQALWQAVQQVNSATTTQPDQSARDLEPMYKLAD